MGWVDVWVDNKPVLRVVLQLLLAQLGGVTTTHRSEIRNKGLVDWERRALRIGFETNGSRLGMVPH